MKRRIAGSLVTLAAAGLFLTGCGGNFVMSDDHMMSSAGMGAAADAMFAQMMIPHHEQAVEMATLAETRAVDPKVKELAAKIKAAQQPEIDQMRAWLEEWDMPVMDGMEAMGAHGGHGMSGMISDEQMDQLEAATGAEFDRLFVEYMIEHHEGAIEMAEDVEDSQDPRVAALARAIIQTQQVEIDQLRAFLERTGGSAAPDASASVTDVALSLPLDHVHAAVAVDGGLLLGTHTGVVRVDPVTGTVSTTGESRDDFMGLTSTDDVLVASGHPGAGSNLPNPVGLIRSTDGAQSWEPVSLTGEIDFHTLAGDGNRIAGAATSGELLYSEDAGATWTSLGSAEPTGLAWFQGTLWIADGSALWTWKPGDAAPVKVVGTPAVLLAAAPDGSRLWALLRDGSVVETQDGQAWRSVAEVPEAAALTASPDAAYVVTAERVYVILAS